MVYAFYPYYLASKKTCVLFGIHVYYSTQLRLWFSFLCSFDSSILAKHMIFSHKCDKLHITPPKVKVGNIFKVVATELTSSSIFVFFDLFLIDSLCIDAWRQKFVFYQRALYVEINWTRTKYHMNQYISDLIVREIDVQSDSPMSLWTEQRHPPEQMTFYSPTSMLLYH